MLVRTVENVRIELAEDVWAEISDRTFAGRRHYSRATYALGCRGPLCKKAEKDRGRRRNETRALSQGREYEPNLHIRRTDRDWELTQVLGWYNFIQGWKRNWGEDAA